jgi:hypothetical protein
MAARLARRGLQHHPKCLLCDPPHSLVSLLLASLAQDFILAGHDLLATVRWGLALGLVVCHETEHPQTADKALASVTLLTPWMMWKQRYACIFYRVCISASTLINQIKDEAAAWVKTGVKELRDVVPTTWDVH